jgi:hypothetical protein
VNEKDLGFVNRNTGARYSVKNQLSRRILLDHLLENKLQKPTLTVNILRTEQKRGSSFSNFVAQLKLWIHNPFIHSRRLFT